MTIHRALSELKLMDSKIQKQTQEIMPVGIRQKDKLVNGFVSLEDFTKSAQSKFDSVLELIKRKTTLKSAIVEANGKTKVKVADKEMTIADAINKKSILVYQKQLIDKLKSELQRHTGSLNKNNETIAQNVQNLLVAALGKDKATWKESDVTSIQKPYQEANEFHLVDPLGVQKQIDILEKEVSEFEAEVDAVLSEINAVTIIEV